MSDKLRSAGGFCVPFVVDDPFNGMFAPLGDGSVFHVEYRVKGRLRRWRLRRAGWSTEWVVEYPRLRVHELIPRFAVRRGV